jgi:hypothetical protein
MLMGQEVQEMHRMLCGKVKYFFKELVTVNVVTVRRRQFRSLMKPRTSQ